MHLLDIAILRVLMHATAPMTSTEIATAIGGETTAVLVRRRIGFVRSRGFGIVNWSGRRGGYIHPAREDLLFPVSIGSVIAELDAQVARRGLH